MRVQGAKASTAVFCQITQERNKNKIIIIIVIIIKTFQDIDA
jgi:hypothetical protein